ncbi:class I adenylate-forming enzyme family protein [Saccharothrix isguenensis]
MIDPRLRTELAERTDFGGGNAWRVALETSPSPDATLVRTDRPLVDQDGRDRTEFSIRALVDLADAWSAWYLAQGVGPRDRVVVWLDDSFEDQVHLAALAQIGAIGVLINGRMPADLALGLMRRTAPVGVYTDERHRPVVDGSDGRLPDVRWVRTRAEIGALTATLPESARYAHGDDDPVVICHTSGTTGNPKPVIWAHRQSVAGVQYRLANHPEPDDAVMLSAAPHSHSGAIAFTLYVLLAGVPLVAISDITGEGLARGIAEHRPTAVLSFNQTLVELLDTDPDPADLASVAVWVSIGDSAHDAHNRALIRFGSHVVDGERVPGSIVDDGLGSSELGWAALRHVVTADTPPDPRHLGTVVPIAEVAVLRPDGTEADADEVGLLGVRSPSLAHGYWNDSDTTYRSQLAGYFLSGDLVYRTADGDFYQVDRAVDAIRTERGDGYSILMEEVLLLNLPEIVDCAVVAGRHEGATVPVAVVRPRDGGGPTDLLPRVNKILREARQPEVAVLEVAQSEDDIPLGATGKILKRRMRDKYADLGTYLATRTAATTATTLGDLS